MNKVPVILIVDDEAGIRYFLEETLVDAGYRVVAVDHGAAALDQVAQQDFDLALLDLRMPGMSGMEVLAALRERAPDTAVVVLTAHASLETAVEALRHGAHDYLFKPCEPEQLRESVRSGLLKRQRQLRHRQVLGQLQARLNNNLEDILVDAFERAMQAPTPEQEHEAPPRFLQHGDLVVDLARHVITLNHQLLALSPTEFDVFVYLLEQAPRVISIEELATEAMQYEGEPWEVGDLVRTHIYRIRQKVRDLLASDDVIHTVRGVGYRIGDAYM